MLGRKPHKATEFETLRMAVMAMGQGGKDKRKVHEVITKKLRQYASTCLYEQITRDLKAQYKYYDALAMWLGQAESWDNHDRALLKGCAEDYLGDVR